MTTKSKENEKSEFPLRFPPKDGTVRRRSKGALEQVPDQPGIEYLVLRSLAEHLGIPAGPNMWMELALELARKLYPEKALTGPYEKWTPDVKALLVSEIDRIKHKTDKRKGITWACKQLARDPAWKELLKKNSLDPTEALRSIYYGAKKLPSIGMQAKLQKKLNKNLVL